MLHESAFHYVYGIEFPVCALEGQRRQQMSEGEDHSSVAVAVGHVIWADPCENFLLLQAILVKISYFCKQQTHLERGCAAIDCATAMVAFFFRLRRKSDLLPPMLGMITSPRDLQGQWLDAGIPFPGPRRKIRQTRDRLDDQIKDQAT